MFNYLGSFLINGSAKFVASFFSVLYGMFGKVIVNTIINILSFIWNLITKYIWLISKWILGMLDAMQLAFTKLLGLDLNNKTSTSLGEYIEDMKDITFSGTNYYDYILKIFRAVAGVALVLMIVFTIIAMVMQEYKLANDGLQKDDNKKGKIIRVLLSNICIIFLLPIIFYTIIVGTNAILTSFYRAIGNYSDVTIAGNVLAASTYDSNRYRAYANSNKRIPITISVYETENIFGVKKTDGELKSEIQNVENQEKLRAIAGAFANNNFLPFEKSTAYENGSWLNYKNYSLTYGNTVYDDIGDSFENFICTREQYYVLADFIDYCQLYNIKYYVKAISEPDICWKYVDNITASIDDEGNANGDVTLDIRYRNAESVNSPIGAANAVTGSGADDSFTLSITTKLDMTSPISDALKTISKLLNVDDSSGKFNAMERDDSGDYTNLVSWSTEKVLLKLSNGFQLDNPSTWTYSDQIIIYEYYHFANTDGSSSSNNVLEDYTLEQLKSEGAKLDALEMTYRNFNSNTQTYSSEYTQYCVKLNGSYYRVKPSENGDETDDYGHPYYLLDVIDTSVNYFESGVIKIQKTGQRTLSLSAGFDLNNVNTWTGIDSLLVYEYFKNLSISNGIVASHKFSDFKAGAGVSFDQYNINNVTYVYINGTYYQASGLTTNFLKPTTAVGNRTFAYKLSTDIENLTKYGLDNLGSLVSNTVSGFDEIDNSNALYQKYSAMNLKLSEGFSFYNSDTWTFRDYAILYIYVSSMINDSTITPDSLKVSGIRGDFGRSGATYYLRFQVNGNFRYLKLDEFSRTSELKITTSITPDLFDQMNLGISGVNFVTSYNKDLDSDRLIQGSVSSHTFNLSENFDAYDPTTWTIGDYLMIYLINTGAINTDIGLIDIKGYDSLIYVIDGDNYYRFGKEYSDSDDDYKKSYFLNENMIINEGFTVDSWFNTNLMSYLLSKKYSKDSNSITFKDIDFAGGVIANSEKFLFDLSKNANESGSIQTRLAEEFIKKINPMTDITAIQYSYSNPQIVADDLTTWNSLDLLIYTKTKTLPTAENPFVSYLIKDESSYLWLKVGDLFANITNLSSQFYCFHNGGVLLTNQIISNKSLHSFDNITDFNEYYLRKFDNNFSSSVPGALNYIGKFYYYAPNLRGSTEKAGFVPEAQYTDFEIILAYNGFNKANNGYYIYEAYESNGYIYIQFDDGNYLGITTNSGADIFYKQNSLISLNSYPFSSDGSKYTSFGTEYNQFDALLYSLLGSSESKEYNIYSFGTENKYILVNGNFIKYDATLAGKSINSVKTNISSNAEDYIDFLYDNYYSTFVGERPSSVKSYIAVSSFTLAGAINVTDIDSWTGLQLILHKNNIKISASNKLEDNCALLIDTNNQYYLEIIGESKFISLSGLVAVSLSAATAGNPRAILTDVDADNLKWKAYNISENGGDLQFNKPTYLSEYIFSTSDYSKTESMFSSGTFRINTIIKRSNLNNIIGIVNLTLSDIKNKVAEWTLMGLLSSYYDRVGNYETIYKYYFNGIEYVVFKGTDGDFIVPYIIRQQGSDTFNLESEILGSNTVLPFTSRSKIVGANSKLEFIEKANNLTYNDTYAYSNFLNDENGDKLNLYFAKTNDGKTFYAVFGMTNEFSSTGGVKYLSSSATGNLTETPYENQAALFTISTKDTGSADQWNMMDFIMSYVTGSTQKMFGESYVYISGGSYYFKFEDKFILIPDLSAIKGTGLGIGEINCNNSFNIINLLTNNGGSDALVFKRDGSTFDNDFLNEFENDELAKNDAGLLRRVDFSKDFNVRDYSTWTVSDFAIYYAFINNYYGNNVLDYYFTFTYIPKFTTNGTNYYDLTYLDMMLAKCFDNNANNNYKTYFSRTDASYSLTLYYDSNQKFYLGVNGGAGYIPISEDIYVSFADMTIGSNKIEMVLTEDDFVNKVNELVNLNYYNSSVIGAYTYATQFFGNNFQTFVNAHGAPGYIFNMIKQDPDTGSTEAYKVIHFASNDKQSDSGVYFKYDKFYEFYDRALAPYLDNGGTINVNKLDITIENSGGASASSNLIKLVLNYDELHADLSYENYFYYTLNSEKLAASNILFTDNVIKEQIISGSTTLERKLLNLRLSSGCFELVTDAGKINTIKINNPSTWTVLDFILIYEFSRKGTVSSNVFKNISFQELATEDYYLSNVYVDGENLYLYLNGNFYNLKGYVDYDATLDAYIGNDTKLPSEIVAYSGIKAMNESNFKVLADTIEFSIDPALTGKFVQYNREKNNIAYQTSSNTICFRYLDMNVSDTNYRINVSRLAKVNVKTLIKKVAWVEKLMTDMQVYYPDLNWSTLIATDGWLDTLGEFTSAYASGLYVSDNNSSNTTAAGLVLSEFFMSVAKPVEGSYADYEYSSMFDEKTIHSMMRSLMGEENYNALVLEAEVFMDYFNSCFAPIIDDFAKEFGEDVGSESLRLTAYKSYLATLLLSSDIGEYLYTIATRIYAEYTIGEYLASAGGDYSGYYSYVNNLPNENGETVDSFRYGTFAELVRYENNSAGDSTPTFTFNFQKAFNLYKDENGKISGITYENAINNIYNYTTVVYKIVEFMDEDYQKIYSDGYYISESGTVIDSNSKVVSAYEGKDYAFCYMIHVYWSIKNSISGNLMPAYLNNYRDYLHNDLTRWNILRDENIETADQYYEDYTLEKGKLKVYRLSTFATNVRLYLPSLVLGGNDDDGILSKLVSLVDIYLKIYLDPVNSVKTVAGNSILPIVNAFDIFKNNASQTNDMNFIKDNGIALLFIMGLSEDSSFTLVDAIKNVIKDYLPGDMSTENCWRIINQFSKSLDSVIAELQEVLDIMPGEQTSRGSDRKITGFSDIYYSDEQITQIISAFQDVKFNITKYITAQKKLDQMQKRSITFTLAQYGANYVSSGYTFSVRNKTYTFKNNIDPSRIAEYVYGGSFLEKVGVGAQYTSADFDGIIKSSKIYDNKNNKIITKLDCWSELRGFASNLAGQTANLYFLTNLGDLDVGKVNARKLTDSEKTQLIEVIKNGINNTDVWNRIMSGKTSTNEKFIAASRYLFSNDYEDSDFENITFEDYKRMVVQKVIDNEQNSEETASERAGRFLTLFNLLGVQFDYSTNTEQLGRVLSKTQAAKNLTANLSVSNYTLEAIKTLSGLANRPTREVLERQYSGNKTANYFDEALGDMFIVCTYQNGLYYPVLGSGSLICNDTKYNEYVNDGLLKHKFTTDYYDTGSYVVMAKGIITASGLPTAIRKYNSPIEIEKKRLINSTTDVYNPVTYYRTDVGANFGSGKDLIDASKAVTRVTTKNYTKYVSGTSFTKGVGSATTYTGKTNLRTLVSSDYKASFVQANSEYLITQSDDYGGISVLDEFSYFYVFSQQTWILLVLAFITIIPVMINALGGVITRIFDLVILFILSPVVVSTRSLSPDGKSDAYKKWVKSVQSVLFGVFGYIIGFSSFTILVPIVYNVKSFISVSTYNKVIAIAGFGKLISYPMINSFMRSLWVITAVSILNRMPKMLLPIITASRGDISSPDPGLGGTGKPFTAKAKDLSGDVEKIAKKFGTIISGKFIYGAIQSLKDEATDFIPGSGLIKTVGGTIVKPITKKIADNKFKTEMKLVETFLKSNGVDKSQAKMITDAMERSRSNAQARKQKHEKDMQEYKNDFKKLF